MFSKGTQFKIAQKLTSRKSIKGIARQVELILCLFYEMIDETGYITLTQFNEKASSVKKPTEN
jgi:hypothetical protein